MANQKILDQKQLVIDEIANNGSNSSSFIFLENSVSEPLIVIANA